MKILLDSDGSKGTKQGNWKGMPGVGRRLAEKVSLRWHWCERWYWMMTRSHNLKS